MVNSLEQGDSELVPVDYSDLLQKILSFLNNPSSPNLFSVSSDLDRLIIDIDTAATQIASLPINNPLGASEHRARAATVNFTRQFQESFSRQIETIRDSLRERLQSTLGSNLAIDQFVNNLIMPLASFRGNITNRLAFTYTFDKQYSDLQKQRLSLNQNNPSSNSILKLHKLTITVRNVNQFPADLRSNLENYIDSNHNFSNSEKAELSDKLQEMVAEEKSDFHRLQRLVDTESLGKLKKEAKIIYLEQLLNNMGNAEREAEIYLRDLIRRLKLIEEYINDEDRPDSDYEANYHQKTVNFKDIFSRSEILDALPIIPIIVGNLGEITDNNQGKRTFIFGLKLKLDGPVQTQGGQSSFVYHLNLLNPESQQHKDELARNEYFPEKVLKIAFLYYFVFASRSNPLAPNYNPNSELDYDPRNTFASPTVMGVLQGNNEAAKRNLFQSILKGFQTYNIQVKIDKIKEGLRNVIKQSSILPTTEQLRYIAVKQGILDDDSNILNGHFFKDVLARNPKESLRYISISDSSIGSNSLCQMPTKITIEDIRYFSTEDRQQFSMEYDIKDIVALPVLWIPKDDRCREIYRDPQKFIQNKLIVFPYDNRRLDHNQLTSIQAFIYRFTFSLLAYICLKILLENAQKNLFIPQMRLHLGNHDHPSPSEEFTAALSKVISHLFKEQHLSSSQGFRIQSLETFRIRNGLSSLYSLLPKKFRLTDNSPPPQLDKIAIIVVSSRESDATRRNANRLQRIANLLGEVISVRRLENGIIKMETLQTFSDNYNVQRLYTQPPVLLDTVNILYQQGYRHFLYIAQAPYSSTLHITQSDEDEGLFFMSPKLIDELKGERDDIKIYPVFFDKYYVRKRSNLQEMCLYIQDPRELTNLVEDASRKTVVFFNLFNGIKVGKDNDDDRFYNGVISYSTLLNIYPGILDDQYIRQALIDDTPLKNDLLQYLTFFHFSRYEAFPNKKRNISLKLDPYKNIIGEESLGSLSLFYHINGSAEFNSLAFLTEVKQVLNKPTGGKQ